ncbi:MAG: tRNA (adenosine(37)-N6)-dimethylallyltransferase MiaA [bacterium]|nr:tRNA (adenosine(37)-N6)-dimethylallyltransferase MiaA [bacterium]
MNSSKNSRKKLRIKPRIIVILGPTASGKSDLAVKIARFLCSPKIKIKFGINGAEIISADSRQVYRGLNIGTGKIKSGEMLGIRHHLLDVTSAKKQFTVVDYQKLASRALKEILKRNRAPIICGGTGFYIDALVYDYRLPEVKPDLKLRKKLARLRAATLHAMLMDIDPRRAKTIDPHNPRRLIRALEIVMHLNKPVPESPKKESPYSVLKLGVTSPWPKLKQQIEMRLKKGINEGLLKEVSILHKRGLSWRRMRELGLEYRYAAEYLTGKIKTKQAFELELAQAIKNYAQRQITWFRKDPTIRGIKNFKQIKRETVSFLSGVT